MTSAANTIKSTRPRFSTLPAAAGDSFAAAIRWSDFPFLYFVLFTASAAVFRFGEINTYLWYLIYAWAAARVCLELPALHDAIFRNWVVFMWPGLALASVLWSVVPAASLRGGLQLTMTTLIAVLIGSRFTLRQILIALTASLFVGALASLVLLATNPDDAFNASGGFRGSFAHKNTLGLRMNIMIATAILLFAAIPKWRLASLVVIAMAAYVLFLSESATSQILALITPVIIIGLYTVRLGAWPFAFVSIGTIAVTAALTSIMLVNSTDPVSYVLDSFGKDATLTGRTWLWDIGVAEIAKHPLIGGGFQAFWSNTQSTEVLWIRHVLLDTVNGFHNVGVEVWNDLGVPGVAAMFAVIAVYGVKALEYYRSAPSILGQFPLFFLVIVIVSASMNNSFFRQHELVHVMICALFAVMTLSSPLNPRRSQRRTPAGPRGVRMQKASVESL